MNRRISQYWDAFQDILIYYKAVYSSFYVSESKTTFPWGMRSDIFALTKGQLESHVSLNVWTYLLCRLKNRSFFWLAPLTTKVGGWRNLVSNHFGLGMKMIGQSEDIKLSIGLLGRNPCTVSYINALYCVFFKMWYIIFLMLYYGATRHNTTVCKQNSD